MTSQNILGLTPEQIKSKKMLVEERYTFSEFKKDWKGMEVGGRHEARALLGIALSTIAITPGGLKTISSLAYGISTNYVLFASLCTLGFSFWKFCDGLLSTFNKRPRAKTTESWAGFKSSIPPKSHPNDLLLGYTTDRMLPVRIPAEYLMRHGYILGQSGVGKTVLGKNLMYAQIQRGGGLIFVDGKLDSDSYEELYAFCCLAGRRDDFLIINPGNPAQSNTYNPVLEGDPQEITARILTLIPDSDGPSAFFRSQATQAIGVIVGALQCLGKAYSFIDLVTLLMSDISLAEVSKLISEEPYCRDARATSFQLWLENYKESGKVQKDGTTSPRKIMTSALKKNLGGLGGELFQFATGSFGEVMNSYDPEVRLYSDILANKIIYVALPTMGKAEASSSLGKMFIGDLRTAISRIQALPEDCRPAWTGSAEKPATPAFFAFFDEVGSYATQKMDKIFEQGRSAGIACYPASQTLANLDAVGDEFKEQVIGNTWTKIIFKLGSQETAEEVADLIGMTRKAVRSEAATASASQGAQALQINPQSQISDSLGESDSTREQEEHLIHADLFKALGMGECVVLFGGEKVYHLKVPMCKVTQAGKNLFGPLQINHKRVKLVGGINLYDKTVKIINEGLLRDGHG
jgi:hypothetical protein